MTAKEKAKELCDKYEDLDHGHFCHNSKQCAMVAVDEILILYKVNWNIDNSFWQEVKTELEKL